MAGVHIGDCPIGTALLKLSQGDTFRPGEVSTGEMTVFR